MAGLNSRQLQYFLAVAEEGQITRAAQRLHIAQPPLSQQIKLLEKDLGVSLLERAGRGVRLTGAGEVLARRGRDVLAMFEDLERELDDYQKGVHGSLYIGTVASSGATILPQLLLAYHARYPGVDFQVREGNTFRVIDLLQAGAVEVGLIRTPFADARFEIRLGAGEQEPMAAAGCAPFLPAGKAALTLAALRDKPVLMHRRYQAMFADACQAAGFAPRVLCMGDDVRSLLAWAESGLGVAVVPRSAMRLTGGAGLICRELDAPALYSSVAAIWLKKRYLSAAARHFITFFTENAAGPAGATE